MDKLTSDSEDKVLLFLSSSLFTTYLLHFFYTLLVFILIPRKGGIDFCLYCHDPNPISKYFSILQPILMIVLLYFIFKQNKFSLTLLISLFSTFLYVYWIIETYSIRKTFEIFYLDNETFFSFLMANSTIFDFIRFLLIAIIALLHLFIFLRFTIENFQAKISLR